MGRFFARLVSLLVGSNPVRGVFYPPFPLSSLLLSVASVASVPKGKRGEVQFIMIPLKG